MRAVGRVIREFQESVSSKLQLWSKGDFGPAAQEFINHAHETIFFKQNLRPPSPSKTVIEFDKESDLSEWQVIDDRANGGSSVSSLSFGEATHPNDPTKKIRTIVFEGVLQPLSLDKAPQKPWWAKDQKEDSEPKSSVIPGYAGLITPKKNYRLDRYYTLALQVQTCGKPYFFNVLPKMYLSAEDIYQALIAEEEPRPMHELQVDFNQFLMTRRNYIKEFQMPLIPSNIEGFSFGIRGEGSFRLELATIEARVKDYDAIKDSWDQYALPDKDPEMNVMDLFSYNKEDLPDYNDKVQEEIIKKEEEREAAKAQKKDY